MDEMNLDETVLKARLDAERKALMNREKAKMYIVSLLAYAFLMLFSAILVITGKALVVSGILETEIGSYVEDITWMAGGLLMYAGWWISIRFMIRFYKRYMELKE